MNKSQKLKNFFEQFPGIGSMQATRFVYFIFSLSDKERQELADLILSIGQEIEKCQNCGRFFKKNSNKQSKICSICLGPERENELLIVATDQDLTQIEKTKEYKGKYFILGDLYSISGRRKARVNIKSLLDYIKKNKPNSITFALPATADGDYTTDLVKKEILDKFKEYKDKIFILGRGISTGVEIQYADEDTLKYALRKKEKYL